MRSTDCPDFPSVPIAGFAISKLPWLQFSELPARWHFLLLAWPGQAAWAFPKMAELPLPALLCSHFSDTLAIYLGGIMSRMNHLVDLCSLWAVWCWNSVLSGYLADNQTDLIHLSVINNLIGVTLVLGPISAFSRREEGKQPNRM